MAIEGVSQSISDKMEALKATVIDNHGNLFRYCTHGIAHEVGNIYGGTPAVGTERHKHMKFDEGFGFLVPTYTKHPHGCVCDPPCCHEFD